MNPQVNPRLQSLSLAVLVLAGLGQAAQPASQPANSDPQAVKARVVEVKGTVEKQQAGQDDWTPVKKDQELGGLTLIRQGFGSRLVLDFAGRNRVEITGGAKMGIRECLQKGKHVRTRVGLKYGAMNASVDSSKGSNDFRIKTPVATAAAKGSKIQAGMSEMGLGVKGQAGLWALDTPTGGMNVGKGVQTDGKRTPANQVLAGKLDTQIGTTGGGLTQAERQNLIQNGQTGVFNLQGGSTSGSVGPGAGNQYIPSNGSSGNGHSQPSCDGQAQWMICSGNWQEYSDYPGTGSWTGQGTWQCGTQNGSWSVHSGQWVAENQGNFSGSWQGTLTGMGTYYRDGEQQGVPFTAAGNGSGTGTQQNDYPASGTIDSGSGTGHQTASSSPPAGISPGTMTPPNGTFSGEVKMRIVDE